MDTSEEHIKMRETAEEEFHAFQKEWKKFAVNVEKLMSQNKVTQRKLGALEKNLLVVVKNTTIDLSK